MPKITFIGAGSLVFTRNLCSDILLAPALQDSTIALMDIDPIRLEQARAIVQAMVDQRQLRRGSLPPPAAALRSKAPTM
jgi:alpha-galactosidase